MAVALALQFSTFKGSRRPREVYQVSVFPGPGALTPACRCSLLIFFFYVDILEKKVDLHLLNFLKTSFICSILKFFLKIMI